MAVKSVTKLANVFKNSRRGVIKPFAGTKGY